MTLTARVNVTKLPSGQIVVGPNKLERLSLGKLLQATLTIMIMVRCCHFIWPIKGKLRPYSYTLDYTEKAGCEQGDQMFLLKKSPKDNEK